MRVVAIAAGNARRKHLALLERAVIVDFVLHLPIGVIEPVAELRDGVRIRQWPPRDPILGEFGPAGMAQPAGLDLFAQKRWGEIALRIAGARILSPGDTAALIEAHSEALRLVLMFPERPPALLVVCPSDVTRALAMTGLTAHTDLRPSRVEA